MLPATVDVTVSEACVMGPLGVGCALAFPGGVVVPGLVDELQPGRSEAAASEAAPWRRRRRVKAKGRSVGKLHLLI